MPTMAEQEQFWDDWNIHFRGTAEGIDEGSQRRRAEVLRLIHETGIRNPTILEVGCATGWLTADLAKFGPATGTDLSPESIRLASERYPQVKFLAGDFQSMYLGQFDIVVCVDSLASIADHDAFIAALTRHVKKDGYLVLTSQNPVVFSRYSGLAKLAPGQVRHWASMSDLRRYVSAPDWTFSIRRLYTVGATIGDLGMLMRIAHSVKLNAMAAKLIGPDRVMRLKEWLGLGQTICMLARRR